MMDYMKGYIDRNRRRRASRNRVHRKGKRSSGTSYYMSKSKYSSTAGQMFSKKILVAAVGIFAVLFLVIAAFMVFRPSSENGGEGQVASGSSVTVQPSGQTTQATVAPTEESAGTATGAPTVTGVPAAATDVSDETKASASTVSPQATLDPDGIAAEIAVVPTLAPQVIPTPEPKSRSKAVALTFDDGPSTENTPKVLEILKQYNAHATFFVVGTRVAAGAEVLKQEVAQGCEIANHSWNHADMSRLSMKKVNWQYNKTAKLVKKLVGYDITLLRPPYGAISQKMRDKLKHPMILWNVDTLDWKSKNPKSILKQVKKNVKDGDIILMHDIHPTTAESLKTVLPWLVKNDYDILTVSELAARKKSPMHNGKAYGGFSGQ